MSIREFPGGSRIIYQNGLVCGQNIHIGPDVIIECSSLSVGNNVKIGTLENENSFRYPGGVRIRVNELVFGNDVQIDRHVLMRGGHIELGNRVKIEPNATINVTNQLVIGANGSVGEHCEISGVDIVMGRQLRMLPYVKIGGGGAFEVHSQLRIGHFCHIGMWSLINTARSITVGDEVGLGTSTRLYTHGAYASALDGKPVAFGPISIGDRTWIPGAIVNPSVTIGKDCVIAVGSVVTRDIPDGSLAAGIPARILKENVFPNPLTDPQRYAFFLDFMRTFCEICSDHWRVRFIPEETCIMAIIDNTHMGYYPKFPYSLMPDLEYYDHVVIMTDSISMDVVGLHPQMTIIDLVGKRVFGVVTSITERLINQLRRYGVRFEYDAEDGRYVAWR
jgi:acetyltransferase-like isoleucine patch superfamily enzyme